MFLHIGGTNEFGIGIDENGCFKSTAVSTKHKILKSEIMPNGFAFGGIKVPKYEEVITGHIEVRQIFKISSIGNIAGSYVLDGQVNRDSKIRVFRGKELIIDTSIDTLQHQKDQVKSVKMGYECGIKLKNFNDVLVGDVLEAYELKQI